DHGVSLEQRRRDRRVVEVHLAVLERGHRVRVERVEVHLEACAQRRLWRDGLDSLVELDRIPERLVSEGVLTERLTGLVDHLRREVLHGVWLTVAIAVPA